MKKYQPKFTYDEVALDGWMAADQFVTGLKAVGADLTQEKLVAAINQETAYNGGGLTTPVELDEGPHHATPPYCQAAVAGGGRRLRAGLRPGTNGQVFTCFEGLNSTTPVPRARAPLAGT